MYFPDINECEETTGVCANGRCMNLDGSFSCICNEGYRPSPNREFCTGTHHHHHYESGNGRNGGDATN